MDKERNKNPKIIAYGEWVNGENGRIELESTISFSGTVGSLACLISGIIYKICSSTDCEYDKFMEYVNNADTVDVV